MTASVPSRAPVDDQVEDDPHAGDPVPVNGGEGAHRGAVFSCERVDEDVRAHHGHFQIQGEEVEEMHAEDHPGDRAIGIVIPAEMEAGELVEAEHDGGDAQEQRESMPTRTRVVLRRSARDVSAAAMVTQPTSAGRQDGRGDREIGQGVVLSAGSVLDCTGGHWPKFMRR